MTNLGWLTRWVAAVTLIAGSLSCLGTDANAGRLRDGATAACSHRGGVGLIGAEALIERGWTVSEEQALGKALDRFARKLCPQPEFLDISTRSIYQHHIDADTVWQYTFALSSDRQGHYRVAADIPSLDRMSVVIRSRRGHVLLRSGTLSTPGG